MKVVRTGKTAVVKYECPVCRDALQNDISEAGSKDKCPSCGAEFEVPGASVKDQVLRQIEADELAKKQAADAKAEQAKKAFDAKKELAKEEAAERHKFLVEQSAIAAREKMDKEIDEAGTPGGKTYIASVVVISALYLLSIGSFGVGILVFIGSFGVWYHARTAERLMAVLVGSGSFFVMAVLFAFAAECFLILIDIRKDIAKIVRQWSIDRREKFQKM